MKNNLKPPKFSIGDKIGDLTITQYTGIKELGGKGPKNRYRTHWYDLVCGCGNKVIGVYQSRLRGNRARSCCNECAARNRIERRKSITATNWAQNGTGWSIFKEWPVHYTDGGYI